MEDSFDEFVDIDSGRNIGSCSFEWFHHADILEHLEGLQIHLDSLRQDYKTPYPRDLLRLRNELLKPFSGFSDHPILGSMDKVFFVEDRKEVYSKLTMTDGENCYKREYLLEALGQPSIRGLWKVIWKDSARFYVREDGVSQVGFFDVYGCNSTPEQNLEFLEFLDNLPHGLDK
jgi:hypothetical protein